MLKLLIYLIDLFNFFKLTQKEKWVLLMIHNYKFK